MSFLFPKAPKIAVAPPPIQATGQNSQVPGVTGYQSLVSTGPEGLTRKAPTRKATLLGG